MDTSRPSSRTDWTRLAPPPFLQAKGAQPVPLVTAVAAARVAPASAAAAAVPTYDTMRAAHAAAAGAAVGAARAPAVRVSPVGQVGVAAAVVPSAAAMHKYVSSSLRPLSFDATARAGTDWKAAVHPQLPPLWYAGLNKGALTRPRA